MRDEVWVIAEHEDEAVTPESLEVTEEARRLADAQGLKVRAFLFGEGLHPCAFELGRHGADVCSTFGGDFSSLMAADVYVAAVMQKWNEDAPAALVVPASGETAVAAPRVAAKTGASFAANAVVIDRTDAQWRLRCNRMDRRAQAVDAFDAGRPLVATFVSGSVGSGRVALEGDVDMDPCRLEASGIKAAAKVVGMQKGDPETLTLEEAECIAAAGRAFTDTEQMGAIKEFAKAMGASVAGSKPTADAGLVPYDRMVGQSSGRRLSPKLFVAAGISGSSHFVEGMKDSGTVVSINSDAGAPITNLADLSVVGDVYEVLPKVARIVEEKMEAVR